MRHTILNQQPLFPYVPLRKLLLVLAFTVAAFGGNAQNGIGRLNEQSLSKNVPFTVTQYSTMDGLTQSQIIDIAENSDGSLFLSTANGINIFNGYEFREIPVDKKYRYHFWDHLYWSKKYRILYGKDVTTSRIIQLLPEYKTVSPEGITFRFSASQNDTMFLCDFQNGLYMSTLPDFKLTNLNVRIPEAITYMYYTNQTVYCATANSLYTYNIRTHKTAKLCDIFFTRLKLNPFNKKVYGLTVSSVYTLGDTIKKVMDMDVKGMSNLCKDIEFLNGSEFYVGTTQGLYYYSGQGQKHYTYSEGLTSESINTLFYNKTENCLFAGTGEKGLMKLQFKNAYTFYKNDGLPASSLSSVIQTTDGKVLLCESCCNIHQMKDGVILKYSSFEGQFASLSEINGRLYCGTWGGGVYIMENEKILEKIVSPAIPGMIVFASFKDRSGNIWIGTDKGVAKGTSNETLRPLSSVTTKIITIYQLRNGTVCLGGDAGFYMVSGDKVIKTVGKADGLNSKEVRSFYEDEEGKIWIGTYGGGLYCYDKNVLTPINAMKNCMLFEDAFSLGLDRFGQIYMTSNFGLWKVSYKALDDFYKKKLNFLVPEHYTQESGILNTEFNGGFQNNYLRTETDQLYFPTIEGVVIATPEAPVFRKLIPKIELTTKQGFMNTSGQHVFGRTIPMINFKTGCVNFSEKFNVYFQYKILREDEEKEWSLPQKESNFSFYQLSPGNYKFVIRAIDSGNDPAPAQEEFSFRILPYFYETTWFRIAIFFFVAFAVFLIIRWRTQKNKELLEKENAVKRQLAELQLEGIQAQMNPHFVFNCLSTIQSLFITGQTKIANEYTSKFSSLMRLIIEHIRKRKISIREEMELLEIYLPLENMQMENEFDFAISVEPGIDKDNTYIHGMIIHTFVENAIKHGIKPLHDKKGVIRINFKKEAQNIVVEIMDNGTGINHTVKKVNGKHISRGLQIIKERINIINLLENINIYTETIDLNDIDKTRTGTLVKIIYPIRYDSDPDS